MEVLHEAAALTGDLEVFADCAAVSVCCDEVGALDLVDSAL